MKQSRRQFLTTTVATAGVVTLLPYAAQAAAHGGNMFPMTGGEVSSGGEEQVPLALQVEVPARSPNPFALLATGD